MVGHKRAKYCHWSHCHSEQIAQQREPLWAGHISAVPARRISDTYVALYVLGLLPMLMFTVGSNATSREDIRPEQSALGGPAEGAAATFALR
jgi:hypothetical protein